MAKYVWTDGSVGYLSIAVIQVALTAALFVSLPMWKKMNQKTEEKQGEHSSLGMRELIKLPGAKAVLCAFFCYCALESTTGLWASRWHVPMSALLLCRRCSDLLQNI